MLKRINKLQIKHNQKHNKKHNHIKINHKIDNQDLEMIQKTAHKRTISLKIFKIHNYNQCLKAYIKIQINVLIIYLLIL